jgi:predicted DNA-binding transcriptional regulator AlpA
MSTNQYLTTKQLAKELGVSEATIKSWRRKGIGPAYFQPTDTQQARKLYPRPAVDSWVESRTVRPGEAAG